MAIRDKPIQQTLRQKVWNYMRRNRNFVVGDIMAITGINYPTLRDLLKAYELAGYVQTVSKEKPLTSNRYKLLKSTGARVPTHSKSKQIVYDPNLDIVIDIKRVPSILKILDAIDKSPITKEEIRKKSLLCHATEVKCYKKLKDFGVISRISPIQRNSEGNMLFEIDFEKAKEFRKKYYES